MCPIRHATQFHCIRKIKLSFSSLLILIFKDLKFVLRLSWHIIVVHPCLITWHAVFIPRFLSLIKYFQHLPIPFYTSSFLWPVKLCGTQRQGSFVTCRWSVRIGLIANTFKLNFAQSNGKFLACLCQVFSLYQ